MIATILLLAGTISFTVYAQLMLKWRVGRLEPMPTGWPDRWRWLLTFGLDPWLLSCFLAGFLAFVCWVLVLKDMELSRAYPWIGLSFILVAWLSSVFFSEPLTWPKIVGTVLVVVGLAVGSQG